MERERDEMTKGERVRVYQRVGAGSLCETQSEWNSGWGENMGAGVGGGGGEVGKGE